MKRTSSPAVRAYGDCCGRWHAGPQAWMAPDAECLMRSRYSAFVLGLSDYLLATWHPDTRPNELDLHEPGLVWLGLEVRAFQAGEEQAQVEFVARCKRGGRAERLHELSRFVKDDQGRWLYLDGSLPAASVGSKNKRRPA